MEERKTCKYCGGDVVIITEEDLFLDEFCVETAERVCSVCGTYQELKIKGLNL